jgi:PIN domain nuclease of toxin-antitoxin system
MSAVIADTHAIVWYLSKPQSLSSLAMQTLDQASSSGYFIYLSATSIIEIQYLIERDRIASMIITQIIQNLQSPTPTIEIIPLDLEIGQKLVEINRTIVPDMPDRIIAATALTLQLPLVTCDHKIQACPAIQTIW